MILHYYRKRIWLLAGGREFPSPVGDYDSSQVTAYAIMEAEYDKFPSPVGDYDSSLSCLDVLMTQVSNLFPSPVGDYDSSLENLLKLENTK